MTVAQTNLMNPTVVLSTTSPVHSYDITGQVSMIEITQEATVLERTTFGNDWKNKGRGLKSGKIKIEFFVDFDVNGIFEIFTYLWDNHETVNFECTDPDSAASVEGEFVMSAVPSFAGKVDEYNVASMTYDLTGEVTHNGATIS